MPFKNHPFQESRKGTAAWRLFLSAIVLLLIAAAPAHAEMTLASKDLAAGQTMANAQVFNQFGCRGANASPDLAWSGAPVGTKSFAVLAFDPDAPTGSGWWHWAVFNIPATATRLSTGASRGGAIPKGAVESRTDFGSAGYSGACPPAGGGPHRYQFTVFALSVTDLSDAGFPLDENAPAAMVSFAVHSKMLEYATLEVLYQR